MYDINNEIRVSYFSLISGNIIVNGNVIPYYYSQVPLYATPQNSDNYILLNSIFSTNFNDNEHSYLQMIVQFMIVTKALQNNAGAIKDSIASQFYSIIYPYVNAHIVQITNGYVFDTKMQNDIEQTTLTDGEKKVINRIVSIRHLIKLDPTPPPSGAGFIYYGTQDTNADPTDFSNTLNQSGNLPISVDYGIDDTPLFYWLAVPAVFTQKVDWLDLYDDGNSGKIGAATDLYEVRSMTISGDSYTLYMTRYLTGFGGESNQVRYS